MEIDLLRIIDGLYGAGLIVIGYAASGFFIRKFSNRADIQDTGTITTIQEAVKQSFQKEVGKMQLTHQHMHTMAIEQRNVIFGFSDALQEYVQITQRPLTGSSNYRGDNGMQYFTEEYGIVLLAYAKMKNRLRLFFFGDQSFDSAEYQVSVVLNNLVQLTSSYIESQAAADSEKALAKLAKRPVDDEILKSEEQARIDVNMAHRALLDAKRDLRKILNSYIHLAFREVAHTD